MLPRCIRRCANIVRRPLPRLALCAPPLFGAALLTPSAGRAEASETEARAPAAHAGLDEIVLRDGRRLRGRVIEQRPGIAVVFESGGVRRTFTWRVIEEVALGAPSARLEAARRAWRARGGGGATYELRAGITGAVLPRRRYLLTGSCATGSGVAPVSIYGQRASDRGHALGGGAGARVGYVYVPRLDPEEGASWWGGRATVGLDLHALYAHAPVGIAPVDGELCSRVVETRYSVDAARSPVLFVHIPVSLGVQLGLGRFEDETRWRGLVVGAAWAPSFVSFVGATDFGRHLSLFGLELSVDFATLRAGPEARSPEAQLRLSVTIVPPTDDTTFLMGALGFGAVWY